jgi:hypothetical protein
MTQQTDARTAQKVPCCGACRFWKPEHRSDVPGQEAPPRFNWTAEDYGHGICRRRPPVFIPQLLDQIIAPVGFKRQIDPDELFTVVDARDATMFPGTYKTEWCGDFDWREDLRPMTDPC